MLTETLSTHLMKARRTNATDSSMPTRTTSATAPSGIGDNVAQATASAVFLLNKESNPGTPVQNRVKIVPIGVGNDNTTFTMAVYSWVRVVDRDKEHNPETDLWAAIKLAAFTCTLSAATGVAGRILTTSDRIADTIAIIGTSGNPNVSMEIVSPATDEPAHVVIDMKGGERLEVVFGTGGSATSANALVSQY